jgi:hypothetical protein
MKEYNWGWWFVLSTIWLFAHVFIGMVGERQIMSYWFYTFGLVLSIVNFLFCLYIGGKPETYEK